MKEFLKRSVGVVLLLAAVRAATAAIAPLNNAFMRELGVTEGMAPAVSGTILAVGYIFAVLGPVIGGRLSDKKGPVQTFLLGGLVFSITYLLWGFAPTYSVLYIYRALLALATGAIYIGAQSFILSRAPEGKKGMGMGLYGVGFGIGSAAGPMIASKIAPIGIAQAFLILAIACIVGTAVAFLIVQLVERGARIKEEIVTDKNTKENRAGGLKSLIGMPGPVYVLIGIGLCYGFAQLAVIGNIDDLGISMGWQMGRAIMGVAVFSIVSLFQPLGGLLGDRFGQARAVVVGMILVTVGFGALAYIGNPSTIFPLMAVAGLGAGLYTPNAMALIGGYAPAESKGTSLGLLQGSTAFGSALGALIGGLVHSAYSVRAPFVWTLVITALGVLLGIFILMQDRKRKLDLAA